MKTTLTTQQEKKLDQAEFKFTPDKVADTELTNIDQYKVKQFTAKSYQIPDSYLHRGLPSLIPFTF